MRLVRKVVWTISSVLAATLTAGTDEMFGDYGVSTNSVVATPVGYEKRVKLDTGETVRMYPDRLDHNSLTNCHGVLFCILSPDELRGKYFLLNHGGCDCYMCRPMDVMTNLYVLGRHYVFTEKPGHPYCNYRKAAFELGNPGNPSMVFDWGERLHCNIEDVDTRLRNLASRLSAEQGNIQRLRDELAKCPKPAKAKLDDEPQPIRDMRKRRQKLARMILERQRFTNTISHLVQHAERRRDWLQAHGGAVTNRTELDRLCWDDRVRALANCQLPSRSYRGATVDEILSDLQELALTNGVERFCLNCVGGLEVRGVPGGVRWMRKYDLELPAGSAQDMFLKVGSLPDVSMRVKRKYDKWEVCYSVPGDSPYADWSATAYMTNCPPVELQNVTLAEAVKLFQKLLPERVKMSFDVSPRTKDIRCSFAFKGKTLRVAIAEVEKAFGVAYDFEGGHWFDPQEPPVLSEGAKLLKCERSAWALDREVRQTVPLKVDQVAMLNEMMKRCEAATRNFVECEYFLGHNNCDTSYGIMVDDALGEVQGFDLGSRQWDALHEDSRQRHYVLLLKNAEDRRKLYSFLRVVQMLDSEGEVCHPLRAGAERGMITQFSTVDALLASAYDGWVTVKELREHGSLGIGTPDRIDGELILLDDVAYSARGDGSVKVLKNSDTIAFASVADTSRGVSFPIGGSSYSEFCREVDRRSYPNQPMAVRMDGIFSNICVRSELAQRKPYRPLAEVMKQDERKFNYQNVKGTLVGFRLPQFVKGENVPGWHLHFISADRQCGGHVLDFSAKNLVGKVYYYGRLQTVLPDVSHDFHKVDHAVDRSKELDQVERK